MKLPNVQLAETPQSKVLDYLLCSWHRTGGPKCAFFTSVGFSSDEWELLAEALRSHAAAHEVIAAQTTLFGVRYRIEGTMPTPNGREVFIRSVWFVPSSDPAPRLVTAYPRPMPPPIP